MKIGVVVSDLGAAISRALTGRTSVAIIGDDMPPPSIAGVAGRAWKLDLAAHRSKLDLDPRDDASVAAWLIEAPAAHPLWHSYLMTLVHLRPLRDGRRTVFFRPDATHEFLLFACHPDAKRADMLSGACDLGSCLLQPTNFAAQLVCDRDDIADHQIERCVQDICNGLLNPDTDARGQWIARFGDAMLKDRADKTPPDIREVFKPN